MVEDPFPRAIAVDVSLGVLEALDLLHELHLSEPEAREKAPWSGEKDNFLKNEVRSGARLSP